MRLRTFRRSVTSVCCLFLVVCVCLYVYVGRTETDKSLPPELSHYRSFVGRINQSHFKTYLTSEIYEELAFDNKPGGAWTQGFPIVYDMDLWKDRPLEVFIVPHSHQDPGWTKTLDGFFLDQTKNFMDAALNVLETRPEARLVYPEVVFLSMWAKSAGDEKKARLKRLLESGKLEIPVGGWVVTDEAVANYYAMVGQLIEGHLWLLENFNYRPNTSWSIDPFGHSSTMAYFNKKMNLNGMLINRVHYEVKKYLAQRKGLEFKWRQPWDFDGHTEILTHLMPFYAYDVPHTCGPEPAICCQFDFKRLQRSPCPWGIQPKPITSSNVAERAKVLADQYRKKATLYKNTDLLLVQIGDDFEYGSESVWNLQLDNYNQLIAYLNSHPEHRIHLRFATLSDYFNALRVRTGQTSDKNFISDSFPSLIGDFFTYNDRVHDYWSGFYSSRSYQKALTRAAESELRSAEILYSYSRRMTALLGSNMARALSVIEKSFTYLTEARRSVGLFQHHDAVTGTEKSHVAADYGVRLLNAIKGSRIVSALSSVSLLYTSRMKAVPSETYEPLDKLLEKFTAELPASTLSPDFISLEGNFSDLIAFEPTIIQLRSTDPQSVVYIFNPLPRTRTTVITLAVSGAPSSLSAWLAVESSSSESASEIPIQIEHPVTDAKAPVSIVRVSPIALPPVSFRKISLSTSNTQYANLVKPTLVSPNVKSRSSDGNILWIQNEAIRLGFSRLTGLLQEYVDLRNNYRTKLAIDFIQYSSSTDSDSHSGAYLFVPNGNANPMVGFSSAKVYHTEGSLIEEVTVKSSYVRHTVRFHKKKEDPLYRVIEIENLITIDSAEVPDIDVAMRIQTNVNNDGRSFYTDSNCFQFIRRQYYDKIPLQGNIYPITCAAYLQSDPPDNPVYSVPRVRFNVLTGEAHGISSLSSGSFYIWLDRRTPHDDRRGLGEALRGKWTARSRFYLFFEHLSPDSALSEIPPGLSLDAHSLLMEFINPPQKFLASFALSSKLGGFLSLMPNFEINCDYELVALKTYHNNALVFQEMRGLEDAQTGLLLRRLPLSIHIKTGIKDATGSRCLMSSDGQIQISSIFGQMRFTEALHTKLTMVPETGTDSQWSKTVAVKPNELEAFLLR
ncbi:unnamed protein product [Calicophoron daubneyi]|uniref:mannosyl-oligosaccharide 1,3-1,6-alpha-mannosidase n=1 Tax=Calicophoron daubneyi TaxID=300641 RepID=A0AAV2TKE5_CALDB